MVITFAVILLGALLLIRPLQKNNFYMLHCALMIGTAYYLENHYYIRPAAFSPRMLLVFAFFQLIFSNLTAFIAYGVDKRAAIRGNWRVPENNLHTLEFMGGWIGAWIAQKVFRHKTKKQSFQTTFKLMILLELLAIYLLCSYLGLL